MLNALNINEGDFENSTNSSSNLLFRTDDLTENPLPRRVFKFLTQNGSETVPKKDIHFKPARIVKGKRWYVTYSYRIPLGLANAGKWEVFKVFEDINRYKTDEYAEALRAAIDKALLRGWSPYQKEINFVEEAKIWTINEGLNFFLQKWAERGLEKTSLVKYQRVVKRFIEWLTKKKAQNIFASQVTKAHVEIYFSETSRANEWSNRTYNNEIDFLNTAFLFLVNEKIIAENPCKGIHQKKSMSKKHRSYDPRTLDKLLTTLKQDDPYLYFAFQCVYYLCVRSEKELKYLRVGNIDPERMQVLLTASGTKSKADRYIPMTKAMLQVFEQRRIFDADPNHYVFGVPHKNKFVPDGEPGPKPFGNGFFSKRFARIRSKLGLSSDWTLYSAKHTRVVHLKTDGASDREIMSLTGHSDFTSYAKYLRDLGMDFDPAKLSAMTRTI